MHVVLSLGSNIDRGKNLRCALAEIGRLYGELDISPVYETAAVGFDGPPFLNLAVGLHSEHAVESIMAELQQIEYRAGRVRSGKAFDSRVLDIDVVLYGPANLRRAGLDIPRRELDHCAHVLKPVADLYPDLSHPVSGRRLDDLWQRFAATQQTVITERALF